MEKEKSLIQKLIEKKYDLNNVYVGIIGRQYETNATTKEEIISDLIDVSMGNSIYRWGYKPVDEPICFFVKTLGGYKRISTGEKYKLATYNTMGKVVVLKSKILPLINVYADLYWRLKEKSNYITPKDARYYEKGLNNHSVFVNKALNSFK